MHTNCSRQRRQGQTLWQNCPFLCDRAGVGVGVALDVRVGAKLSQSRSNKRRSHSSLLKDSHAVFVIPLSGCVCVWVCNTTCICDIDWETQFWLTGCLADGLMGWLPDSLGQLVLAPPNNKLLLLSCLAPIAPMCCPCAAHALHAFLVHSLPGLGHGSGPSSRNSLGHSYAPFWDIWLAVASRRRVESSTPPITSRESPSVLDSSLDSVCLGTSLRANVRAI